MKKKNTSINWKQWLQWGGLFIVSLIIIFLAFHFRIQLRHFRSLGLLGIFFVNFLGSATLFLPAPAIATVVAGGAIYPPLFVALLASVGATLGDSLGFFLGLSGTKMVSPHHKWYVAIRGGFKNYGALIIFLFAFIPNPAFDAIGIMAGALGYPVQKFLFWLFLGRLLRDILLAFLGANINNMRL